MESTNLNPIIIFCAFILALVFVAMLRKIYYYARYRKRFYIIPRVSIKGISNIAIIIAISVVTIIMLTIATADLVNVMFRAWPGTRITIEGLLIKIGGLLFGPFIGLFIGAMTDLLTVALTAGVFHYGYFIAAMAYGLISGLISDIFRSIRVNGWSRALLGTLILAFCMLILYLFFAFQMNDGTNNYNVFVFGIHIKVNIVTLVCILLIFITGIIILIWTIFLVFSLVKKLKDNKKSQDLFVSFVVVLVVSVACNAIVNVIMMPSFDEQLSSIAYSEWVIIRSVIFIPEIIFNCSLIIPIYQVVSKRVDYDYKTNLIEDIKYPVYIE